MSRRRFNGMAHWVPLARIWARIGVLRHTRALIQQDIVEETLVFGFDPRTKFGEKRGMSDPTLVTAVSSSLIAMAVLRAGSWTEGLSAPCVGSGCGCGCSLREGRGRGAAARTAPTSPLLCASFHTFSLRETDFLTTDDEHANPHSEGERSNPTNN